MAFAYGKVNFKIIFSVGFASVVFRTTRTAELVLFYSVHIFTLFALIKE
jgi:hypothetical protein